VSSKKSEHKWLQIDESRNARKSPKITEKRNKKSNELREGNRCNHECFHTTRGQILYRIMRKIYPTEQRN
jgi:hypothetical protein